MPEISFVLILNASAFLVAISIVIYALWRLANFRADIDKLVADLHFASDILKQYPDWNSFRAGFEDADRDISSIQSMSSIWRAFQRQLIRSDDVKPIKSPAPADEFFNYALLYRPELNLRKHEAVPNQLVGIGLFFTFLGLAISLGIASGGLSGDMKSAKASLIALLAASAIKFVTSIAAIGAALVFTHYKNQRLAHAYQSIETFASELDYLTVSTSAIHVAEGTRHELVKQTEILLTRDEGLAEDIAAELDQLLKVSLAEALAPVAQEIASMGAKLGDINEAAMRYIVDRFSKELGSAAQEHSERMTGLLNEVSLAVKGVPEGINNASSNFTNSMKIASEDIGSTFGQAGKKLSAKLDQVTSAMAGNTKSWSESIEKLSVLQQSLVKTKDAFSTSAGDVEDATKASITQLADLIKALGVAKDNLPALDKVSAQLENASGKLEKAVEQIGKLDTISEEAQHRSMEAGEQFLATVSSIEKEMKGLDEALGSVFQKTGNGLAGFQQQTEEIVSQLDQQLAIALDRLSSSIDRMGVRPMEHSQKLSENGAGE